jgi:hypothetical protein
MGAMAADRDTLLGLLATLDRADAAANDILALDAGTDVDALAEAIGKMIEEMRASVEQLLRS